MATKFKIVQDLTTGKQYLSKTHFINTDMQVYFAEYKDKKTPKKMKQYGLGYGEYNDNLDFLGEIEVENVSFDWRKGLNYK